MSLNCKLQISINNISEKKAEAVQKALAPDNINFPKDLSLKVEKIDNKPVSYTHLTLPTKRIV